MKTLLALLLAMVATVAHASAPPYFGNTMSTQTGTATQYLSGNFCVAASSLTAGTCAAQVDGRNATITATTFAGALSGNAANVTGIVLVGNGGTGSTTASGARTNLSAAQSGANGDITSMTQVVSFPNGTSASSGSFTNGITASSGTFTSGGVLSNGPILANQNGAAIITANTLDATTSSIGELAATSDSSGGSVYLLGHGSARTISRYGLTMGGWGEISNSNVLGQGLVIGTPAIQPVVFGTNYLERMRVAGNGNVGIGITTPATTLDVNGGETVRGQETVTSSMTVQGSIGASTITITGTGPSCFNAGGFIIDCTNKSLTGVAGSSVTLNGPMAVIGGNVGIGTASPAFNLDITATSANGGLRVTDTAGPGITLSDGVAHSYRWTMPSSGGGTSFAEDGGTPSLTILHGGNVGIGTTSPATKLHMSSGTLTVDGTGAAIQIYPGGGTAAATVGGNLFFVAANAFLPATTVETTLATFSIPAGTIDATGRVLSVHLSGTTTNNADVKTLRVKFNGATYSTAVLNGVGSLWTFDAEWTRAGPSSLVGWHRVIEASTITGGADADSPVWGNAQTLTITGQSSVATASDITLYAGSRVDYK